ncbi:MAG: hypothetical protein M5R36_17895 [Deltaproteobacteria bacterium]|nr:hypothetical protein [Deltaproteobacteria bacterium]
MSSCENEFRYPSTVVISAGESESGSCEVCRSQQGAYEITSPADLESLDMPPYHPNCVCEAVLQDGDGRQATAYGTTREMADLLLQSKKVFEEVTAESKYFGGLSLREGNFGTAKLIAEWYWSRLRGDKNPELACRARADWLLQKIESRIPKRNWFVFNHVRAYIPKAGWNLSHSWVELRLQYKDKHGDRHKVVVKYDPYYNEIVFMDPDE